MNDQGSRGWTVQDNQRGGGRIGRFQRCRASRSAAQTVLLGWDTCETDSYKHIVNDWRILRVMIVKGSARNRKRKQFSFWVSRVRSD